MFPINDPNDPSQLPGADPLTSPEEDLGPELPPVGPWSDEMEPTKPLPAPTGQQLKLSERELARLGLVIERDYNDAINDHQGRMRRFMRYFNAMRRRVGMSGGEDGKSNFSVPLTKWQVYSKLAKEMDAMLGDDAEIVGVPTGPSDTESAEAVGKYMTWRVFSAMRIVEPLTVFNFRRIVFGRAHAYVPYVREEFDSAGKTEVDYEGPRFCPLWPDDLIVPAEDAKCIDDFSWVIRRYWTTPDEILSQAGTLYFDSVAKPETFEKIVRAARDRRQRDEQTDEIKRQKDAQEGVLYDFNSSCGERLEVWEWYGRRRMPKGRRDVEDDNLKGREMQSTDLVVRYIPFLPDAETRVVGAQKLADLYPRLKKRRPIVEAALMKDGSYWGPSLPEMLEDIEMELTVNENLMIESGEASVGPVIAYRPTAGANLKNMRWEPRMLLPVDNPADDIQVLQFKPDVTYAVTQQQNLIGYAERLTGISDQNLGRTSDRPNQPRTARQTVALLDEGNIRGSLDVTTFRDDLTAILRYIWALDSQYSPPQVFYRVTERRPNGLYDSARGFGKMTAKERAGRYDFEIKFATGAHSREARKQSALEIAQLLLTVPIVATNPQAQWKIADKLCKAHEIYDFASMVQKPPELPMPMAPEDEFPKMLQGEIVKVHPLDDHPTHIETHKQAVTMEMRADAPDRDYDAIHQMLYHITEHEEAAVQQAQQQQLMAGLQALGTALAPMMEGQGGAGKGASKAPNAPGQDIGLDALTQGLGGGMERTAM